MDQLGKTACVSGSERTILVVLTLFAAFAFGANLATALHEFGHALGCWIGGGTVNAVYLRPFDFSYVETDMGTAPPWVHMVLHGGGIFFGLVLALPLGLVLGPMVPGSMAWLACQMTLALAFGLNGVLLLQCALTGAGDPASVLLYAQLAYHWPVAILRLLMLLLAVPVLVIFGRLLGRLLAIFGPAPEHTHGQWLGVVLAGFMPYFLLMTGHTAIWGDRALLQRQFLPFYLQFMMVLAALLLGLASWVYKQTTQPRPVPVAWQRLNWPNALGLLGLAILVICIELTWLAPPSP